MNQETWLKALYDPITSGYIGWLQTDFNCTSAIRSLSQSGSKDVRNHPNIEGWLILVTMNTCKNYVRDQGCAQRAGGEPARGRQAGHLGSDPAKAPPSRGARTNGVSPYRRVRRHPGLLSHWSPLAAHTRSIGRSC